MTGRVLNSLGPGVLSGFKHRDSCESLTLGQLSSLLQFLHFQNGVDDPTYQIGFSGVLQSLAHGKCLTNCGLVCFTDRDFHAKHDKII